MPSVQLRAMDYRLASKIYDKEPQDIVVTSSMSVAAAVGLILAKVGSSRIARLTLLCHGYNTLVEGNTLPDYSASIPQLGTPSESSVEPATFSRVYGGYGLEWGDDDVNLTTVSAFGRLNGMFTAGGIIVVFGCAAAGSGGPAISQRLGGDGPALMRALARYAGAPVRASDALQDVFFDRFNDAADRKAWSGRTILFMPDGRQVDESKIPMSVY
jgi:hypothetical protein